MKNDKGVITLEACVVVLSFLILMLLLSSLFVMFMAQNVTSHTVLQTSQSLSMEAYSNDQLVLESGKIGEVGDYLANFFGTTSNNPAFSTSNKWYEGNKSKIAAEAKNRFVGYLSGGDEEKANDLLKLMNVVDGLNGLNFSESYIEDDTLYIVLKYQLEYDFNIWDVGKVDVKQTTCSQLWRHKELS